jgi:hypothetical protein
MPTVTPTPTPTFTPIPSGLPVQKVFVLRGSSPTEVRIDQYSTTKLNIMDTLSFDNVSFDVSNQARLPTGIFTDQNGSNCFVVDSNVNFGTGRVYKYTLSTPWDLATISYSGQSLDVSVNPEDEYDTINPSDVAFGSSGTRLYILDNSNNELYAYELSVAYDLSTANYLNKLSLNQKPERPYDAVTLAFDISGDNLYVLDAYDQTVEQFELGTSWDISAAVFATEFRVRASNVYGLSFNSEGTRMFVDLGFAFVGYRLDTPWDISTASIISFSGGSLGGRVSSISLRNSELGNVTPTPTATVTPTISLTPSVTPSVSVSATATPTPTVSPSADVTPTPSVTVTPTVTVTPSADVTPTVTPTVTASVTPTPTAGVTPTISPSSDVTPTPSTTAAVTPTPTETPPVTPTVTPSVTPSGSPVLSSNEGFVAGGAGGSDTIIESFPFSNPFTTATSIGNLSAAAPVVGNTGTSTDTDGYVSSPNGVDRFSFNAPYTSSIIGTFNRRIGGSAQSTTDAYLAGGQPSSNGGNHIDSFPFSTPFTTTTFVGSLGASKFDVGGHSSATDGYISGGITPFPSTVLNTVEIFPFSSPITSSVGGTLSPQVYEHSSVSSPTDGYVAGGRFTNPGPFFTNNVERFPFTTPFSGSTLVGDLTLNIKLMAGMQSDNDGYVAGGQTPASNPSPPADETINRFPFAAPFTTAADIGDLTQSRIGPSGHQS